MHTDARYTHRIATRADLPRIVEIYNATIPSRQVTADLVPVSVASREPWFDAHAPQRHPLWVAERDRQVVGWLSYSAFHSRSAYDGTAELGIYVNETERGHGLGRQLLRDAIAHAPALGLHTLVGLIFGHNAPSLALFEAHGFARWGDLPEVAILDGVARDLVIVGRKV
ncbi:GNAT family N-acetyltransferase [Chitiniphilus eburneus]|uniref:N-acetyltransferase n=1 Tax=Chitiniphilus eburneus TaxID=2571148 RepID=A0A4U0Q8R0_9NEIS|nr:GNAT family N-acetyltransferase [Chitiniphilus eburneus]TJZ77649.1 N-acetyltransferase [Chitiniphilus eburneus]